MICIFTREISDELASLVKKVDQAVGLNESRKLAAFLVLLADDPASAEQGLRSLAKRNKINRVPLTVFAGTDGPTDYAIDRDATVTVLMWGGEKKLVRVNHTFGKGTPDETFIAKVVADMSAGGNQSNSVSIGVFNTPIAIERLKHLGTLTNAETLELQDVNLTAAGLKHLQDLTKLRSLNLFRNKRLTDAAVETLVKFTQLEELNISSTQITDMGLARLASELTKLKKLNFRNSRQISDKGLEPLLQRRQLKVLLCGNTSITDAGLVHIGKLSSLHELEVRKTKITDNGIVHLAKLTSLRKLNCSDNNKITSDGVSQLGGLAGLRSLDLSQTRIDDAALAHLENLAQLNHLDLSKTRITSEGLSHLHHLQNLKFLNLFETQANQASILELQRALPNCEILR